MCEKCSTRSSLIPNPCGCKVVLLCLAKCHWYRSRGGVTCAGCLIALQKAIIYFSIIFRASTLTTQIPFSNVLLIFNSQHYVRYLFESMLIWMHVMLLECFALCVCWWIRRVFLYPAEVAFESKIVERQAISLKLAESHICGPMRSCDSKPKFLNAIIVYQPK